MYLDTRLKKILRGMCFLLILCFFVVKIQKITSVDEFRSYLLLGGFYLEKKESLDVVYIGSSNVYAFWTPSMAWSNHGLVSWSFSVPGLPSNAIKYLLIEARKTQPTALFIININTFIYDSHALHRTVDYLPWSLNKQRLINRLTKDASISGFAKLEYFFPVIRFHTRWSSLGAWVFKSPDNGLKGGLTVGHFLTRVKDITKQYCITQAKSPPRVAQSNVLTDLLDYCDNEKVKVLFVTVPQSISPESCGALNYMEDTIKQRGYPVLNMMSKIEKTGIQTVTDFYDEYHTNIHGAIKFTEYLSHYLIEHYGFKDKRGQFGWESWDKSVELYGKVINPWTLPLEREYMPRDYSLAAPSLNRLSVNNRDISVSWKAVKSAEGYEIYRKSPSEQNNAWHLVKTVGAEVLAWLDTKLKAKAQYTYTVVPYRKENNKKLYGHFSFNGMTATTGGK